MKLLGHLLIFAVVLQAIKAEEEPLPEAIIQCHICGEDNAKFLDYCPKKNCTGSCFRQFKENDEGLKSLIARGCTDNRLSIPVNVNHSCLYSNEGVRQEIQTINSAQITLLSSIDLRFKHMLLQLRNLQ